ncbi:MAG: hypothetical protein DHS20C05_21110 [Hyphococcus sp.]|nr:MAG: hypothetical protein DHS20C05_21110 [Marinicaulis sp.]
MYEEYFNLAGSPFRLNPDPKFFFGSRSHNKAMAYLHYGLKQAEGFIVITGPVGTGKTMLIGHLLDQLNSSNVVAANLLTSNVEPDDLLGHVLSAFRIEPASEGRTGQLEAFEDYLFDQLNRGRRVLLIMDEAQNLPHKTLEELRMLSNIDYDGTPLFQVFLVGQPEFRDTMQAPEMEQLKQRVIASYHLENLSEEEAREYILHRLTVAGWREDPIFKDDAFDAIFEETSGRPRRINTLCNRLMLYCSLEKQHEINADVVKTVVAELHEEKLGADSEDIPSDDAKPAKTSQAAKTTKTASTSRPIVKTGAGMSVLDRLRAKREGGELAEETQQEPEEATLTDVASAIAAVIDDDEQAPISSDEVSPPTKPDTDQGNLRKSVMHSLDGARDELKQAHESVKKLRNSMAEMKKRRTKKQAEISASLSQAEVLLNDIRNAWR